MSFDGCDWGYEIEQLQPVHSEVYELIRDYTLFSDVITAPYEGDSNTHWDVCLTSELLRSHSEYTGECI